MIACMDYLMEHSLHGSLDGAQSEFDCDCDLCPADWLPLELAKHTSYAYRKRVRYIGRHNQHRRHIVKIVKIHQLPSSSPIRVKSPLAKFTTLKRLQ